MYEKKLTGNTVYSGKILNLDVDTVLCQNGNESLREVVRHHGGAAILAITKDKKILLERQYRYPFDEIIYEIPAGKIEKKEDPMVTAYREFEEETGYKANKMELLTVMYPSVGYTDEKIFIYYTDDFEKSNTHFDEDEFIMLEAVSLDDVLLMIKNNTIKDAKTSVAIMQYLLFRKNNN